MAFSFLRTGNTGLVRRIYNFDRPVTKFGGGNRTDVMLLQALFRIAYYELPDGTHLDVPAQSTGPISVDGIMGSQSRIHIEHFQNGPALEIGAEMTKDADVFIFQDGVIDPMPHSNLTAKTKNTKTVYELAMLNTFCNNRTFTIGKPEIFQRMIDIDVHSSDDWPKGDALRSALRTPRKG